MTAPSLELQGIRKSFATHTTPHVVLDDLDLTLMRGERLGICGLNGAGKSTLINIVAGNLAPDRGRVLRHARISWPLGYAGGFHSALTGLENVRFIARIYGRPVNWAAEFAEDFAELGKFFHMPMRTYSSGMRSRLAFAVSMAIDFELYLIDEAMSAGDLRFHEKCRQAIEERRGRSDFLIVSHSLSTIEANCNRFAVLHNGKLTTYDDFAAAMSAYSAIFTRGQKSKPLDWKLDMSGLVQAQIVKQASDSAEIHLLSAGAGTLIAYWGKSTEFPVAMGDGIAIECPVQRLTGSVAQVMPEWTGLQLVERDRVGGAVASCVAQRDFLNGSAQVVTAQTAVASGQARNFQFGVRIELSGPADMRLRLGRPFLRREIASAPAEGSRLN